MSNNTIVHYKKVFSYYGSLKYRNYNNLEDKPSKKSVRYRIGVWIQEEDGSETTEKAFIENYGNKLFNVFSQNLTLVIEETDNKISLKVYNTEKNRYAGRTYFKVRRNIKYITFNTLTNNFYIGEIKKSNKKNISNLIRTNKFNNQYLTQIKLDIRRLVRDLYVGDLNNKLSHCDFISNEIISVFFMLLSSKKNIDINSEVNDIDSELFRFYLDVNGFKYPNTYREFKNIVLPKNKLKKNNNIVSFITNELKLSGDKIKRILNELKDIDIQNIYVLYHMLGVNHFNKLDDGVFQSENVSSYINLERLKKLELNSYDLNNNDKLRIVNVLNQKLRINILMDHLDMIYKLQNQYDYKFKMRFKDRKSFDEEHYELSQILSSYSKGYIIRNYGDKFNELIEKPIIDTTNTYYPVLLTNTDHYNKESYIQSNCVRTYTEKPHSIIISLREGDCESKERATIEYQFRKNNMVRVQSLGKYNKNLKPEYDSLMEVLDNRIKKLYNEKILSLPTMVKKYKDGTEVKRVAYFQEENQNILYSGLPIWDNEESINENYFFENLF
jgi:hypothetical protein